MGYDINVRQITLKYFHGIVYCRLSTRPTLKHVRFRNSRHFVVSFCDHSRQLHHYLLLNLPSYSIAAETVKLRLGIVIRHIRDLNNWAKTAQCAAMIPLPMFVRSTGVSDISR